MTTALPVGQHNAGLTAQLPAAEIPSLTTHVNPTFKQAKAGDCLTWPDKSLDQASVVDCKDDHRFEVAESVDMSTFPGSEYGPDAAPPTPARVQQITQEQCQTAVERYLGPKFDPDSRFAVSMLWSGDRAWSDFGERRVLCGVQLPGPDNQQVQFTGKVADIDQSKAWPTGTCLGIEPTTNQQTDIPVDCAAPHAMEVTGTVNLAEKFPGGLPAEADQDAFVKDTCTRMTDAYLAPVMLRTTTLTLTYSTVSLPSWAAGSRQVSCMVGATLGNGGWATVLNSAKGPLLINGQPPVPPPDIPLDRLNMPPRTDSLPVGAVTECPVVFARWFLFVVRFLRFVVRTPERSGSTERPHARASRPCPTGSPRSPGPAGTARAGQRQSGSAGCAAAGCAAAHFRAADGWTPAA